MVGGNFLPDPKPSSPKLFLFFVENYPINDFALEFLVNHTLSTLIIQLAV